MAKTFSCIFLVFTVVNLLLLLPISAQTRGNIPVGSSLSATGDNSSWLSPSGDFAFGFHKLPSNNNLFLLAIWYDKIPDTIVWYANEGNPVQQGSTVNLTADAGLVLKDPKGTLLWNSSIGNSVVSYGFLNDTGNFVLRRPDSASAWESFLYPTDTLLPTQVMERGGVLYSRSSDTDYTRGRFLLALQSEGSLVLTTRELTSGHVYAGSYYSTGDGQGYQLIYNKSGNTNLVAENSTILENLFSNSSTADYQRATLNYYGVLTWYSYDGATGWKAIHSIPDDICSTIGDISDSGACGFNSICEYDQNDQRPHCSCPPNYSKVDPNDNSSSCRPDFRLQFCDDGKDAVKSGYKLVLSDKTDWLYSDYATLENINEEDCKNACFNDCFCAVVIFRKDDDSAGSCWKKRLPLSNGRIDATRTAWLKVANNDTSSTDPNTPMIPSKVKNKTNSVISVLLGGSAFINLALLSAIVIGIFFFQFKKQPQLLKPLEESDNVHCFSYKVLEDATNGFSEELGRGAFGVVYKGMIKAGNSEKLVAVKKLHRISNDTDKEFMTEVNTIGKTHHKNLVHLVGFCKEEDQRLMVYEFMSNGTLADFLFGDLRPSWVARVQIAQEIARGLFYLHEECSNQIIHCDIKPQNILLDDYRRARIADFGLAKLLVLNQTHTNTAIRGTKGYVAPEWFRNKPITVKVDVYSFGVVLLEIICCRRSVSMAHIEEEGAILTDLAFDCYQLNTLDAMVRDDMEALEDKLRLHRFLLVALWCIQEDPNLRPTMRVVLHMLDGLAEVPNPPYSTSFTVTTT